MSLLLRAILVVGFAGLVLQACGQEEAAAPAEAPAAAAPAAETSTATGGYEQDKDKSNNVKLQNCNDCHDCNENINSNK